MTITIHNTEVTLVRFSESGRKGGQIRTAYGSDACGNLYYRGKRGVWARAFGPIAKLTALVLNVK